MEGKMRALVGCLPPFTGSHYSPHLAASSRLFSLCLTLCFHHTMLLPRPVYPTLASMRSGLLATEGSHRQIWAGRTVTVRSGMDVFGPDAGTCILMLSLLIL